MLRLRSEDFSYASFFSDFVQYLFTASFTVDFEIIDFLTRRLLRYCILPGRVQYRHLVTAFTRKGVVYGF